MAQAADVPARELVSQTLRGAARLEPRSQTLSSKAALLYGRFNHSLVTRLEDKERHGLRIAPDTTITLCAELAVARYLEPDFLGHARDFRTCLAPARRLFPSRALAIALGVRPCTDSGWSLPTLERHHRMTVRCRTWETVFLAIRGQRGAIQRGRSAPSRFPVGIRQEPRERGQRVPHPALAAPQGDARNMVLVRQIQRLEGHPGSDYHGASTLAACCRRPRCTTPAVRKRLSPDLPLLRLPRCSAKPSVWSRNADHIPASRLLLNTDFHLRTPSCRPCSGAFGNRVPLKTLYGRVETSCP